MAAMLLAACAALPDPDIQPSDSARNAPWPTLLPMDQLQGRAQTEPVPADAAERTISRSYGLRDRARRLRALPIIEQDIRNRMNRALARRQ